MPEPRPGQNPPPEAAETEAESPVIGRIEGGEINKDNLSTEETPQPEEGTEAPASPEENEQREAQLEQERAVWAEASEIAGRMRDSYERSREGAALAEYVGEFNDLESLKGYFEEKQDQGLFENVEAETLAQDIATIEKILNPQNELALAERVKAALLGVEQAKVDQGIAAVREALYTFVLEGHMTGEQVAALFGRIVVQDKPGAEYKDTHDPNNIFAYFSRDANGNTTVFLYGNFFTKSRSREDQVGFIHHEAGHLIAPKIFGAKYRRFKEIAANVTAENLEDSIKALECPELGELLRVIAEPQAHKEIWSRYIGKRLDNLAAHPTPDAKSRMAAELVAEMSKFYFEQGSSAESYLASRIEGAKNPDEIIGYLARRAGTDVGSFYAKYKITPEMGLKKTIALLSIYPEFAPLFRANGLWYQKLSAAFANRGENFGREEGMFEDYGWDDLEMLQGNKPDEDELDAQNAQKAKSPGNAVYNLLGVLTGRTDIFGGGAAISPSTPGTEKAAGGIF